jgi:glycosyltransferase involved in cell wall biosynthesis
MRVLVQIRANHAEQEGGDTLHAVRTAEELRALGVHVDVTGDVAPDLGPYDLVHLFNTEIIEPTLRHALRARACGLPIVLSPVFWRGEGIREGTFSSTDVTNLSRREWKMREIAVGLADVLLPNSRAEADVVAARFPVSTGDVVVAKLGIDPAFAEGNAARFCREHGLPERGFVLCAARLEARKNQHVLVAACADLGVPLVLAGAEYEDRRVYANRCRALADERGADVRFLPHLDQEALADAYAAARVHALPSLWESVGLSSVEAALAGCNVVSTVHCGIGEYLGDDAWYCEPESVDAVREAVAAAFAAELDGAARDSAAACTWEESARATLEGYEAAMRRRDDGGWSAPLGQDAYIEHLESLIQLQLETIALRDAHYATVRESADEAIRYAQALEAERERLEEYAHTLEAERERIEEYAHSLEEERRRLGRGD